MTEPKKSQPRRKRARNGDGQFKADNPDTQVNEAWEPVEVEQAVGEKSVDYSVRQKVDGTSKPTAGKYGKKPTVRPTFGGVTSESK